MEKQENQIDYVSIQQKALEQFRSGKSLTGKGGLKTKKARKHLVLRASL